MRTILGQTLASTHLDAHDERASRELLERICQMMGKRSILNHQHDMSLLPIGFAENPRVIPDPRSPGEFLLVADVHFDGSVEEAIGGFSYSITEDKWGNLEGCERAIYLPRSAHGNMELVARLLATDSELKVGHWVKKAFDPDRVALVVGLAAFVMGPEWNRIYEGHIRPGIVLGLRRAADLLREGLDADFIQLLLDHNEEPIEVYFVLDRSDRKRGREEPLLKRGLEAARQIIQKDHLNGGPGIKKVSLYFDAEAQRYNVHCIEQRNGELLHVVDGEDDSGPETPSIP